MSGSGFGGNRYGYVWFDVDADGVRDAGEPSAYVRTTNRGNIPSGTTLVVPSSIAAGQYPVQADLPSGWPVEASAPFTVLKPNITASAGSNGSISPSGSVEVEYTANQTFDITSNTGYHVADVLVDGASVGAVASYEFANVTADHTISVSFAVDTFTIVASAGANGTISPSGTVVADYGSGQAFSIVPNTGYHVADVLVDGVSVGQVTSYEFTNINGDHSIWAMFAVDVYTITASAGANGTISPVGNVWLTYGSDQAFSIVPDTGGYIDDVLVDGVSVGAVSSYQFTGVAADHTISAAFVLDTTPPAVPALVSPSQWKLLTGTASLDWSDVSDPAGVTYEIKLYDSSWSVVASNTGLTTSLYPLSSFGALPDGIYYWRVRALDGVGNEGAWSGSWAFKFATSIPAAPTLLSPSMYARVTSSSVLDWSDVTDPDGVTYQLELYDQAWSHVTTLTGLTSSDCAVSVFGSLPDGQYAWRVRAVDGGGIGSSFNGSLAFKLANTQPAAPTLLSPSMYGWVTSSSLLDWSDVTDPDGVTYQLELYDQAWSHVTTLTGLTSSDCAVSAFGSLPDGQYAWRVRAVDGGGITSSFNGSLAFKLANTVPAVPTPLSPSQWKRVTSSSVLDWSDVSDPEGVTYEISLCDSSWAQVANKTGLTSSEIVINSLGSPADGIYYWRVRAVDGGGITSNWCGSYAIKLDNTVPPVPDLVSPADGATTSSTPTLDWSDVTDASGVKYQIQLDDNSDFSSPLLDVSDLAVSEYAMVSGETLPAGTYYWRTRAVDGAGNASAWSDTWTFVV